MALALALMFASFASEFKATKVEKPRVSIIQSKLLTQLVDKPSGPIDPAPTDVEDVSL